jgi:hypothetical protein
MSSTVAGEIRSTRRVDLLQTRGLLIELNRYLFPLAPGASAYERLSALLKSALGFFRGSIAERDVRYFIVSNSTLIVETYAPVRGASARTGLFRIPSAADERLLAMILTSFVTGSDAVFATASDDDLARLSGLGLLLEQHEIPEPARSERTSDPWLRPVSPPTER